MAPASLLDLVSALPDTAGWGPPVTSESMLDGVPFAPYSKADKLGRMADWTEGKDRERGGRQQYGNRNYRGMFGDGEGERRWILTRLHRPAGIRREPADQPLRHPGRRRGGNLLRRRQHTHISTRPRIRTRRRHRLPWTWRSARWTGATRRAGHLPACWWPWWKPVRQPARWTWRQGRTSLWLEGRQAPAQP